MDVDGQLWMHTGWSMLELLLPGLIGLSPMSSDFSIIASTASTAGDLVSARLSSIGTTLRTWPICIPSAVSSGWQSTWY